MFHQIENRRNISYPGVDSKARATINGWQIDPHVELGCDLVHKRIGLIEPYVAFDLAVNWEGSFTEKGAGNLNMTQKANTAYMLQSEIGSRFCQSKKTSFGRMGCKEGVSYINRAPFGTGTVTTALVGSPAFVTLQSFTRTQNLGALFLSIFSKMGERQDVLLSLSYEGQFGSGYIFNEVLLNLTKRF